MPSQINGFCTCLIWNKHSISHVLSFPSVFIIADTQLGLSITYSGSFNIWTPSSISLTHTCNKQAIWLKITALCSQLGDLLVLFLLENGEKIAMEIIDNFQLTFNRINAAQSQEHLSSELLTSPS